MGDNNPDDNFNVNDIPDAFKDTGGAFVDTARGTDAFGSVVDCGLKVLDRLNKTKDGIGIFSKAHEQATGPDSGLD